LKEQEKEAGEEQESGDAAAGSGVSEESDGEEKEAGEES